ncbi:MAG TPA: S53 family peptidase [Gemmataceae bacterium]|nr:S53 family peptidase [Gemmataceae bacterium]
MLESRDLLSATAHPTYVLLPENGVVAPLAASGPTGTTPTQIRHAYGFDQISFSNGKAGDGSGETIAIVDAYDDPNIASDLHQFDVQFNLPDPAFSKVNQNGGTSMPAGDPNWATEITLDVEWAHAIAPGAGILLVEANDSSYTNLLTAVSFAAKQTGVVAVSMSWGGGEFSGETGYDSTFQTPSGHGGVTFVASSGDSGAPASYPAASPNVLAVGGTTLNMDASGNIISETGWSGSGGGISSVEAQPSYQKGVVNSTRRANPDVAYDADPNTGFPIYDTYGTSTPWAQYGGTSAAAPQWAALIAIADQGRAVAGLGSLDGPSQTLPNLYGLPAGDFHDITAGTSTGSPQESAGPGYDLVTGRGTPVANLIVAALSGQSTSGTGATHLGVSVPTSSKAGALFSITVSALDANGNTVTNYTGSVHFTSTDSAAALPADYTFAAGDNGVHTFTATLKSAGNQTITVTDRGTGSIAGSGTVSVAAAAASRLGFGQQPTNAGVGAVINPAVTVQVLDAYGNVVTGDNIDQVTIAIGTNAGGGTLSGSTTATVSGGVATFSNLSINAAGSGYTLTAASGSLSGATSAAFNVSVATSTLIEGFETSDSWNIAGNYYISAYLSSAAAHDGNYGLDQYSNNEWIYRNDSAAQLSAGDTASVWLKFSGAANGRAYFGFGASSSGTLSLVAAPNTGQLIIQENLGFFNFTNLAAVSQSFAANHWYRLEVDWGASGKIIGKLFDSNGTTLLRSVTATTTDIMSGGIAFRATGYDKYWDTVTAIHGVNGFALPGKPGSTSGTRTPIFIGLSKQNGDGFTWIVQQAVRPSQGTTPAPAGLLHKAVDHLFATDPIGSGSGGQAGEGSRPLGQVAAWARLL